MVLVGTALFAMLLAGPAMAQPTGVSPVQVDKPAAPAPIKPVKKSGLDDPKRIVCKREHVVGSNRPQKVCMTVAERQRLKDQADQLTDPGRRTAMDKATFEQMQAESGN